MENGEYDELEGGAIEDVSEIPPEEQQTALPADAGTAWDTSYQLQEDPLIQVQQQKKQYLDWFKQSIAVQAGLTLDEAGDADPDALADAAAYASLPVPQLITNLHKSTAAYSYLSALKYWAESVRELERKQRHVHDLVHYDSAPVSDPQAYTVVMQAAIQALGSAVYAAEVATYYASSVADVPQLGHAANTIEGRMQQCRHELHTQLTSDANTLLETCHWPPPLVESKGKQHQQNQPPHRIPNGDVGRPLANGGGSQHEEDGNGDGGGIQGENVPQEDGQPQVFTGFDSDESTLSKVQAVLSCLTSMQLVVERTAFASVLAPPATQDGSEGGKTPQPSQQDVPLLWAATCLSGPLQARLQLQFQPHTGAGRLDQPAWLFKLVMKLVQGQAEHMSALQPVLESNGLGGRCHMVVEWSRAMREATKAVLRTSRLPALVEEWERRRDDYACIMWGAHVDAMLVFESQIAPYLGAPAIVQAQGPSGPIPSGLLSGNILGAITDDHTTMTTWAEVLRHQAVEKLEAAVEDKQAWQASVTLLPDSNGGAPSPPPGSSREFNPPRIAEVVAESLTALVNLSARMPTADAQRLLLDQVGGPILTRAQEVLRASFEQAAQYQGLVSKAGAPWAGACVSAARYLYHTVSELLAGPSLHRLHSPQHGSTLAAEPSSGTQHISTPGVNSLPGMQQHSPGIMGDVVVNHSFTPATWDPPVLSAAVSAMGSTHREMSLRVARDLSTVFGSGAASYRESVRAGVLFPTHTGAAGTVSPALLPALTALQAGMSSLSIPMDGPSFRDIWRAVSVAVNRFMFNYIATEARFTAAGGEQFAVDCSAVVSCFTPYTTRPAAHFREMLAASRLVTLTEEEASDTVRRASKAHVNNVPLYKEPKLAELGVGCLLAAHVIAVIERRV